MMILSQYHIFELDTINIYSVDRRYTYMPYSKAFAASRKMPTHPSKSQEAEAKGEVDIKYDRRHKYFILVYNRRTAHLHTLGRVFVIKAKFGTVWFTKEIAFGTCPKGFK